MRTTLDLNDELLVTAKTFAARHRLSLTAVIENSLRRTLTPAPRKAGRRRLPLLKGKGGMRQGINAARTASMLDAADGHS